MLHAARDILARLCEAVAAPQLAAHLFGCGPGGQPRSPKWPPVRRQVITAHPFCSACGRVTHLTVHHRIPFWVDRSRELDPSNCRVLCEYPTLNCHLWLGHSGDYARFYNLNVDADCEWFAAMLARVRGHFA